VLPTGDQDEVEMQLKLLIKLLLLHLVGCLYYYINDARPHNIQHHKASFIILRRIWPVVQVHLIEVDFRFCAREFPVVAQKSSSIPYAIKGKAQFLLATFLHFRNVTFWVLIIKTFRCRYVENTN